MTNIELQKILQGFPDNMPVRIVDCDENGENFFWQHIRFVERYPDVECEDGNKPSDHCSPFISIY